ncbi:30S ribosomal protein S1 [Alicyclobacillus mali]|uniref:30S ribosomal protein S1 n=1 Tax=Alicyclobacillus mali (ex Roth et al. 2021) TaxID=1123961 RepID=A0ABS0EZB5_9BACL|nr:30S ribosomal protein S1 [Alicyclobacillus mali (ex Roth et al. 2021)]MBF8376393.1 30S ribosomal protein S1 [Alicyclobacillus mali (ex Roth et al. 2021)]
MSEDLREMLTDAAVREGDVVTGEVTAVDDHGVTVALPHGYEGHISPQELSALPGTHPSDVVSVGSTVTAQVLKVDMESGHVTLSKRRAEQASAWERMQQLLESGEPIEVEIRDVVKGGLVADVGVRAFIPASLVDRHFVENLEQFKGQTLRAKVIEVDPQKNKLILSRRAVLEEESEARAQKLFEALKPGDVIEGTVQRLTDFGAFVDVGGADGLVHISELSFTHVNHPSEVVHEGDRVKVRVLRVDPEAGRISLSIKAALPEPWETYANEFRPGDVVQGVVRRVVDFGAFVELRPGLEGLVHVSQISNEHVDKPSDVLQPGQEVTVRVLSVDPERKRISLSMRDSAQPRGGQGQGQGQGRGGRRDRRPTESRNDGASGPTLGDLFGDLFK